jgi:hypothetical protein
MRGHSVREMYREATAYTNRKPTTNDNTNKNNSPRHPRATRTAGASHSTPLHTISRAQCTDRTCYRPRQHSRTLAGRRVDTAEHQRPLRRRSGPPKPCDEPTHQWERPQRIRRKEGTNHLRRVDSRGEFRIAKSGKVNSPYTSATLMRNSPQRSRRRQNQRKEGKCKPW